MTQEGSLTSAYRHWSNVVKHDQAKTVSKLRTAADKVLGVVSDTVSGLANIMQPSASAYATVVA